MTVRSGINYERRGSGSPLVLLHGIGHRWQAWEPVLDRLTEAHDVIALDLPGFGESTRPATGLPGGIEEMAEAVAGFLDELGVERPHVAGNSLGGAVSLELAAAGRVTTATALSPAGFFRAWETRWAVSVLRTLRAASRLPEPLTRFAASKRPMRAATFGMLVARPGQLSAEAAFGDTLALRDATAFRALARAGAHYQYRGRPTVPVTIAWGDRDRLLLPRQAERAALLLPQARHVPLPGCGHVPMSDAPDLVASVIMDTTAPFRSAATA